MFATRPVLFLGAVFVPTSLFGAAVVGSPDRLWPSHTIDYIVCDQSFEGARRDPCKPQAGKGSSQALLRSEQARLVRTTAERWNLEFGNNLRLREVSRARATSTLVFRASSRPTRCSTQGVGFLPRQRLKYVSIGSACTPGALGRQTNMGTVAHEILHAIGFYHEQQRGDRARLIRVRNVGRKARQWQPLCDADRRHCRHSEADGEALGSYDFGSLMHYSLGNRTARATAAGRRRLVEQRLVASDVGQREWLTLSDIRAIRALYPAGHLIGRKQPREAGD
ncbi:MAG: M12 family metallopeptidase [Pseudomonadota bacterium]